MESTSKMKLLIKSRAYIRKRVTERYNIKSTFVDWSDTKRESVREELSDHLDQLKTLNQEIQNLKWIVEADETWLDGEFETCESYCDKIRECMILLKVSVSTHSTSFDGARSLLRSPTAPLPEFKSLEGEDFFKFLKDFESVTGMFKYSEYDKFILLKQQISGRALILLNSLESDKQGYTHAKTLLTNALSSEDNRIFNVLQQLCDLKMTYDTDPFEYVSKMRNITETVERLDLKRESFLRYFFWQGLNDTFQMHMTQITNSVKPTYEQINDHFFEAAERYQLSRKKFDKRNKGKVEGGKRPSVKASGVYAADVQFEKEKAYRPCSLCTHLDNKEASHPIYKCVKFESASSKIDQIDSLQGCTKCSNLNHTSEKCKFRFNTKCRHCKGWHFSFLCVEVVKEKGNNSSPQESGKGSKVKSKSSRNPKQENSQLAVVDALGSALQSDSSILPTFSCILADKKIRALKDGGCQSNFVTEHLVNSMQLKVLDDKVALRINGINVSQEYMSKLVELELVFGTDKRIVQALSLPSINIDLKIPGLGKVVECFKERGYKLADDFLSVSKDRIHCIDLILGTKSGYCIPDSEILFGYSMQSVYSNTPYGLMLKGEVGRLMEDLDCLPSLGNLLSDAKAAQICSSSSNYDFRKLGMDLEESTSLVAPLDTGPVEVLDFRILDKDGHIVRSELERATKEVLDNSCNYHTHLDSEVYEEETSELNTQLVKFCLENTHRNEKGRLVMPLLWNAKASHLLGQNFKLSKLILRSNFKKLSKDPDRMKLMNDVFKEQEEAGIIERIGNLEQYLQEHPSCSFLPHMGVFKLSRETTKCRIVFLSNLCERDPSKPLTVSHNQAIHSGPCLNQKLSSALLHLRFDQKLLCFDLVKAFNQIALEDADADKLLFLWYRNVERKDFEIVAFRNVRLSFGLRCSPTILLLGLYHILILDSEHDPEDLQNLKESIYSLCYMDNCAFSENDSTKLKWAYDQLQKIFSPYHFGLQQFVTNDQNLQSEIDLNLNVETPDVVKLLGVQWNRIKDTLSTKAIQLEVKARTKREILSTIASQFDLFNINGPILNRSRLFLHDLQCKSELGWDDDLSPELLREWQNIARQANATPEISIPRCVGHRSGSYRLVAFCDSSKSIFGVVVLIQDIATEEVNFLLAKNRIVNKQLEAKSIPSLEMQGLTLATDVILDLYRDLAGSTCVKPLDIRELTIFSDSLVALSWLNSYSNKMSKMQKRSVFVMNRIHHIVRRCEEHPITYSFISGVENPADAITRCLSYKKLMETSYFTGPNFLRKEGGKELNADVLSFTVPNICDSEVEDSQEGLCDSRIGTNAASAVVSEGIEHLVLPSKCSSFHGLIAVCMRVLKFIHIMKVKLKNKDPVKYSHIVTPDQNFFLQASKEIIRRDQRKHFPEIFEYFESQNKAVKDLPDLVAQLNLYMDQEGLLRVQSKCDNLKKRNKFYNFPLLLSKNSQLTILIILDLHSILAHAGCYSVLREMRRRFYVPHYFSVVKKTLRGCVTCRRFKERTISLNQSPYKEWRICPPNVPYRYIFMDFLGPIFVKQNQKKEKVYLLCITCMWSRAVNLVICVNLSVAEFLRAFQLHCFQFGLPEFCISDLGSQLVSASNIIVDYLKDHKTQAYFQQNGVQSIRFEQFAKGHSQLGSMVEVCVKMVKRLIFGAIKKNVLVYRDFEYLVAQTIHLVNRRPVAFKEALRDGVGDDVPDPITPEALIHGFDLTSVNVIPELHAQPDEDWVSGTPLNVQSSYHQLQKVRHKLIEIYQEEFLANLTKQAVDVKGRYKPVTHKSIKPGDIVLIKEQYTKPHDYPMGLVKKVEINSLGEVTEATILKGKSRELIRRHSSVLIPLLTGRDSEVSDKEVKVSNPSETEKPVKKTTKRKAAIVSSQLTKQHLID